MYVEDSIRHVDQYWVEYNRKVVNLELQSVKNNEDEIFGEDEDQISHAIFV
jgi:hypothetical protein